MATVSIEVPTGADYLVLLVDKQLTPLALTAFAARHGYTGQANDMAAKLAFFKATLVNYIGETTIDHYAEDEADTMYAVKHAEFSALIAGKIGTL